MGLDLAVYPLGQFPPFIESHVWLAHTRIGFHRESALFKIIMRQLPQIPVPDQVEISGYFSTYRASLIPMQSGCEGGSNPLVPIIITKGGLRTSPLSAPDT